MEIGIEPLKIIFNHLPKDRTADGYHRIVFKGGHGKGKDGVVVFKWNDDSREWRIVIDPTPHQITGLPG